MTSSGQKRIVVLGCGGFIGSHLLDRLLARSDIFVEGWDPDTRKISEHLENPRLRLHPAPCENLSEAAGLEAAIEGADAVVNLAAICNPAEYNTHPLDVIRANFVDVFPIVDLCAKHRRWLIHFSTSEVYGRTVGSYLGARGYENPDHYELRENESPLIMGPTVNQRWTYACAKQLMERYIIAHHAERGLPFTIVRPFNFFGPRMDFIPQVDGEGVPRVLACFMTALMTGGPMQLVDGGSARRTIVAIEEAIDAVERMLERPGRSQGETFNIGNPDNEVTVAELAGLMREVYAEITGDEKYHRHPIEEVTAAAFYGPGYEDCDRRMPDISKAETLLDWRPRAPLRQILLKTMRDYHERYRAADRVS